MTAVLLAGIMAVSLAGCSESGKEKSDNGKYTCRIGGKHGKSGE